jgi:hypothetical protein
MLVFPSCGITDEVAMCANAALHEHLLFDDDVLL